MSLKRGAERQLTRDGADEEVEAVEGDSGFKKADDNVLASRPMRGLPKRSAPLPSSTVGVVGTDSTPTGKLGGPLKGFGSTSSSPFTFSTPTNTSSNTSAMPPTSSSDSPFKFSTPSVAASASSATKQFASFLGSASSQTNGVASTPSTSTSSSDPQVKYYAALRGLNLALKAEIEKAVSNDPFIDISLVLENYKRYREDIEKEHNPSKRSTGLNGAPTILLGSTSNASQPAAPTMPAMPTPPASFSFAGSAFNTSPATSTPVAAQGGFKTSTNGISSGSMSGFTFGTPPPSDKSKSSPFSLPSASASPSFFGQSNATKPSPFGISSGSSSSPFGTAGNSSAIKPPTSVFGSGSVFGSKTESIKTESADSGTNASSAPSNPFGSFTSPSTQPSSGGFSFAAKPSGSSVGFAFGSPTPEPEGSSSSSKGAGESSTLKPSTSLPTESRDLTPASTDGGDADESKKQLGVNPNDLEGEGEEEEETLHTSRVKVYKLGMKENKQNWAEMGVGMLRLKKHKELGSKRLLSRNSATGKIMINFKLYKGLSCSLTKQSLGFMGHEDGKNVTYRVRLKDEADATALKEAIDKEVTSL